MFFKKIATTLFVTAVAAAPSIFAQTTTTTSTTTRDLAYGPIGIGPTETLQINVANTAANSTSGTAASCTGTISFLNSTGNAIGTSASYTLTAGQISSVALPFAKATTGTTRVEIRATVALTTTNATPHVPCTLDTSVEVYDTTTGATHVYLVGPSAAVATGGFGR